MWIARAALVIWVGFWAFFTVGELLSASTGGWSHVLVPMAPVLVFAVGAWVRPIVGGSLLIAGGIAAFAFFDSVGAWLLLAGPAVGLGIAFLTLGVARARRKAD